MELNDFNRYAEDFEKKSNLKFLDQELEKIRMRGGLIGRKAQINMLSSGQLAQQQQVVATTAVSSISPGDPLLPFLGGK